jgi:LacI family repressor for deo operon, udp, cdd, tsx, nupC, and nupG
MNLNTLAKFAGVSVATVSKAFSGSDEISEETRAKIFSLAREHGCFDKYNKNKFDKKVIAVIAPELNSDYYTAFLTILDRELTEHGGIMTVSPSNFSHEREAELFAYYSSYCKADGIIVIGSGELIKNPFMIPSVCIGGSGKNDRIDSIRLNLKRAMEDAITYLKCHGHREIGFVGEQLTTLKREHFLESLQQLELPVCREWIRVSNERFERAGVGVMEAWLSEGTPLPTAIVAAYDQIAIGIIQTLKKHGIRVPEDISVIGSDEIPVANYLETSLSTIRTHTDTACRMAVELITKKIDNPHYSPRQSITLYSEFIPRETSSKAKK